MGVGVDMMGMVQTNIKIFFKETIKNLTNNCPGGSYLVLRSKPMVIGVRHLVAIGYKYNAQEVLSFIVAENAGITNSGIPYLSKYPDQFYNVSICFVSCPLVMSKFFGSVN